MKEKGESPDGSPLFVRRRRDSNPRTPEGLAHFECALFDHLSTSATMIILSDISPLCKSGNDLRIEGLCAMMIVDVLRPQTAQKAALGIP